MVATVAQFHSTHMPLRRQWGQKDAARQCVLQQHRPLRRLRLVGLQHRVVAAALPRSLALAPLGEDHPLLQDGLTRACMSSIARHRQHQCRPSGLLQLGRARGRRGAFQQLVFATSTRQRRRCGRFRA